MDGILQSGLDFIAWLQSLGSWLAGPMAFLSFLGKVEFYLVITPAILWCWDITLGLQMGIFLMIGAIFNNIFKILFHGPRPYWIDSRLQGLSPDPDFGIPSGHAQNTTVFYGTLAVRIGTKVIWIVTLAGLLLIGLSRLYLAAHFPHDVLAGWLLGGIFLFVLIKYNQPFVIWLKKHKLSNQLLIVFSASMLLVFLGFLARYSLGDYTIPQEWIDQAAVSFPDDPITPLDLSSIITNAGTLFGYAAGAIWLEHNGGFSTRGLWWQKMLRYFMGMIVVFLFWYGLGMIFPHEEAVIPYILRYLRYALVGFWVTGLAPFIFRKIKLA